MELLLIRHAESNFNSRKSKHLDSKLTARGKRQGGECAEFISRNFEDLEEWQGITSPYFRTLATSRMISKRTLIPFKIDWRVREYGHRSSGYHESTIIRVPERREEFPEIFESVPPKPEWAHGYETEDDLLERLVDFIQALRTENGKYIVVSHGVPIYTMIHILNGSHHVPAWDRQILNTSISHFEEDHFHYIAKFVNTGEDPRKKLLL